MTNRGIYKLLVCCSLVVTVSGLRYKCHKDICDSSWQFCSDLEERCSTCTPEQCLSDVADTIFNQCEEKCKAFKTTSTSTPVTSPVTPSPSTSALQDVSLDMALLVAILIAVIVLSIGVALGFCNVYMRMRQTTGKDDIELGSSVALTHMVEGIGEVEKRPLLDSGLPSDSPQHHNKIGDMRALAQATTQGPVQVEQAAAPPSYSTDVPRAEPSPVKQPSSDENNVLSMKLGNTDFLSDDFTSQAECVTRPKQFT